LALPFKSKNRLEAENAALRHQLIVLRCKVRGRVRLTNSDRWFFIRSRSVTTSAMLGAVPPCLIEKLRLSAAVRRSNFADQSIKVKRSHAPFAVTFLYPVNGCWRD
jgi:hypothetical protein